MKIKVNLDTSIYNLLYIEYMNKADHSVNTETNEAQNDSWCEKRRPISENEE